MANQKHLGVLKQGVEVWNRWRKEYPDIQPNLITANLKRAQLSGIDFHKVNLRGADLKGTDLKGANLNEAELVNTILVGANLDDATLNWATLNAADLSNATLNRAELMYAILTGAGLRDTVLSKADLRGANLGASILIGANLNEANLSGADFSYTYLNGANLRGANLHGVNFSEAQFRGLDINQAEVDLSGAKVGATIFGDVDLHLAKGLDTVDHIRPSTIGIDTIVRSQGSIPEVFLRGAGLPDTMIEYIHSLIGKPIDLYSCFISYSSRDEAFAKRLYADLQSKGVRCWFAPEDLKLGERIGSGIDEAIRLHDKLLLVLSKHSVASGWVEHEVRTALAKERKEKRAVLFPIRVDNAIFESPLAWATEIRHERNIGDFIHWKNHNEYQKAFARLLRDLKAETSKEGG